ncbi:MAG: dTMP kinase [Candidatus Poribacteria bacterium]|nr:dTMP kinase [Candidatus Poribacteria bacterium]
MILRLQRDIIKAMKHKGFFITLEGVEGAGKTTQIQRLADALGDAVLVTREPGGTPLSEQIRDIFLTTAAMSATTELMLIAAARAQHVTELILPALNAGQIVICDRFSDATVAYQGYRKGIDLKLIEQVNHIATGGLTPDVTFLLDLPPDIGLQRKRDSDEPLTRLEHENLASHKKVREGYLAVAEAEPQRVQLIDAQLDADTIHNLITTESKKRIQLLQTS